MKEKHIRLSLTPDPQSAESQPSIHTAPVSVVGWNLAARAHELNLDTGSLIDLAYRIRENDHPQYGGMQLEIAGIELAD